MNYVYILIPKDKTKNVITYETNQFYNSYFFDFDNYILYRYNKTLGRMKRIFSHDNKY